MTDIQGIPFQKVHFDKSGKRLDAAAVPAGTTDLVVVSHGWNNDEREAEALYTKLFSNLADVTRGDVAFGARKLAIVGVIWPSKRFDELMTHVEGSGEETGGARSVGAATEAAARQAMIEAVDRAAPLFDDPDDAARREKLLSLRALVERDLEHDEAAQAEFVKTLREVLDRGQTTKEQASAEDSSDRLLKGVPAAVFQNAMHAAPAAGTGGPPGEPVKTAASLSGRGGPEDSAGGAAGIRDIFSKAANAVVNLLNVTTYFEMKQRAGTVGKHGVAPLIDELAPRVERIHLVGHSFGGRLVTAAAASSTTDKLHSLSLLQAAFSHNGFSDSQRGFFRSVVAGKRVRGPVLVTHTKNDKAVGLAYPAASRINRDAASGFGDADDKFGGIGSNGAQKMPPGEIAAAAELLAVGGAYAFQAGRFHNLRADAFIRDPEGGDAHGFVWVPEVAWALSRAILS
jgi:predicted alpha/beta hydrolase family esterase